MSGSSCPNNIGRMANLIISKDTFAYLVSQRGEFAHLAEDEAAWYDAFYFEMQKTINQIGFVPHHILDLGSGLGVVDALMAREYGSYCTLVDAENGDGKCVKHNVPFCNRDAVERFMFENDVPPDHWRYVDPANLHTIEPHIYDLVLSLRSWCFHYPPSVYMEFVRTHAHAGARIILDVRKDRRDWRDTLRNQFYEAYTIEEGRKHDRVVFIVRGRMQ